MGTYWIVVNHTKRQRIEPEAVGLGGIRANAIIDGPIARLLAYVMLHDWLGDHVGMIPDGVLGHLAEFERWPDVTRQMVDRFNQSQSEPIAYNENSVAAVVANRVSGNA